MEIRFRNYLDCASIKEAFENDITFSMMMRLATRLRRS